MCNRGDDLPQERSKRPYVPVLRHLNGKRGIQVQILSDAWYATLEHWHPKTREFIRHTTRDDPCAACVSGCGKPRWKAWVFCIGHDDRKVWVLPITDTAIIHCPEFKQLSFDGKLMKTSWRLWRRTEHENGPMCIAKAEDPLLRMPHRKLPELMDVVLSLFDRHAGPPALEEPS